MAILAVGLPVAVTLPKHLCILATNSLRYHLFYLRPSSSVDRSDIRRGDYVRFHRIHPWSDRHRPLFMVKQVGCAPGDELTVTKEAGFFCNGEFLGRSLPTDSAGRALPRFAHHGIVPEGSLFVVGHDPRTYDSRYFGFVAVEEVTELAFPIF